LLVETEAGKFAPQQVSRVTAARVPAGEGELLLDASNGKLELGLKWRPSMSGTGEPPRPEKRRAICIQLGQVARLVINGRHADSSGQRYTEDTFNVALVEELQPDLFIARSPDAFFSMKADLF